MSVAPPGHKQFLSPDNYRASTEVLRESCNLMAWLFGGRLILDGQVLDICTLTQTLRSHEFFKSLTTTMCQDIELTRYNGMLMQ